MATVTLRPDGVVRTSTDVPPTFGGAASLNAAVANEPANDATFVRFNDYGSYWMVEYSFGTTAIPTNAAIRSVTPRVRHNNAWSAAPTVNRAFSLMSNGVAFSDEPITWSGAVDPMSTTFSIQRGIERTAQPNGGSWSQDAIDALTLRVFVRLGYGYAWSFDVSEIYLDVVYNVAPVATGTDLGTVPTSRPAFAWTYTDTEGDAQERFRVRVFSFAQYNAGGFDPKTTTPVVDSGEVYSSATSWTSTVDLENTLRYRGYISVSDAGSNGRFSPITAAGPYSAAVISLTPPAAPTLTATTEAANGRVALAITSTNNINPATTYRYSVQRSTDGGTTWVTLERLWVPSASTVDYAAMDFATTAAPALTVYDYEAPRGVVAMYRTQVKATKGGNSLQSPFSATATAAVVPAVGWKLRPIMAPASVVTLRVHSEYLTWQSDERQSVVYALGRPRPVVLSDVVGGDRVEVDLSMLSEAEYAGFEALRARMDVLLLQTSYGDARFVRFGQTRSTTHIVKAGGVRKYVVRASFIEVDA